ncbi:hypothetical protein KY329_02045 [Candidatus Woesearchaeota archaeon]|nr:hypothetical protein [Candidatus Woesearchaeota archaeon]
MIALIVIILIVNQIYINFIFTKNIIYRKEQNYQSFIKNKSSIEYVFFGDSHTHKGVDPEFLPGAYNYGLAGEQYKTVYLKLKKMLEQDKIKIKNAIFELDVQSFASAGRDEALSKSGLFFYLKTLPFLEAKKISGESLIAYWIRSNLLFIGNGEDLRFIFSKPKLTKITAGWNGAMTKNFSVVVDKVNAGKKGVEGHFEREAISNDSLGFFLKSIQLARDNNISIIFVKYPVTEEYYHAFEAEIMPAEEFYSKIFSRIDEVLDSYSVLDYHSLFFGHPELFADTDHLNDKGAELFSKQISVELQKSELQIWLEESIRTAEP